MTVFYSNSMASTYRKRRAIDEEKQRRQDLVSINGFVPENWMELLRFAVAGGRASRRFQDRLGRTHRLTTAQVMAYLRRMDDISETAEDLKDSLPDDYLDDKYWP